MKIIRSILITLVIIGTVTTCQSSYMENKWKITTVNTYDVTVSCNENNMTVYPNETAVYCIDVTNTGTIPDTYSLDCPDLIDCCYWSSLTTYRVKLNPNETEVVILIVTPYLEQEDTYTITVRATSLNDSTVNGSIPTFTTVILTDRTIDVSTDKPVYEPAENITLILKNIHQENIEGNPEFEIFNKNGELVYGCYPDCWITLEPGETFNHMWEPQIPWGKYVVKGRFTTSTDVYTDTSVFFLFDNNQIEVSTDKLRYNTSEIVCLMITNIGEKNIDGNPQFDIFDRQGNTIFSLRIYLWINLSIGETWFWEWDQKDNGGQQVLDGKYFLEGCIINHTTTSIDYSLFYIGENTPPDAPLITGPAQWKIKIAIDYNFTTMDPDGDAVSYYIEWGDGTDSGWIGPYTPGETVTKSHTWSFKGVYIIKAKAMDTYGLESPWASLTVSMPYSYDILDPGWICGPIWGRIDGYEFLGTENHATLLFYAKNVHYFGIGHAFNAGLYPRHWVNEEVSAYYSYFKGIITERIIFGKISGLPNQ